MIILEYDVPTAGTRVSFVLKDAAMSCTPTKQPHGMFDIGDKRGLPDTLTNLLWCRELLNAAIKQAHAEAGAEFHVSRNGHSKKYTPTTCNL